MSIVGWSVHMCSPTTMRGAIVANKKKLGVFLWWSIIEPAEECSAWGAYSLTLLIVCEKANWKKPALTCSVPHLNQSSTTTAAGPAR